MKIVFAGTPEFAVPALNALLASRHEVSLVVTQPDRPAGRGRLCRMSPVKERALACGVPVIQPQSINGKRALDAIGRASPEAVVVVAYGCRFRGRLLSLPEKGCFNIHASLLPRYRGAAPVHHAILNGDAETGVTIQRMVGAIDSGPIVAQRAAYIYEDETTGELSERLAALAADTIVPTLDGLEDETIDERPQDSAGASPAPKLKKADGSIPWHKTRTEVYNFIRGMTPWPGAFTRHAPLSGGKARRLTLLAAAVGPERRSRHRRSGESGGAAGKVVIADKQLAVATGDGLLTILRVIPEGAKPMSGSAYLRGHAVQVGDRFIGP